MKKSKPSKKEKKDDFIVKEYVRRLSDGDLQMVSERLSQPVFGDRADVSLFFEKDKEIDRWLCSAKGWEDWFDRVDTIEEQASSELVRRQRKK